MTKSGKNDFNTIFVHLPKEKKMKAIYKYDGPLGTYALEEQNGLLTRLWLGDRMALLPGETEISETPLLKEAHLTSSLQKPLFYNYLINRIL